MSDRIVRIDQLGDAIKAEIDAMNKEVIEKTNKAAEKAAKNAVKTLKATSPVRKDGKRRKHPPGSYAKSWTVKNEGNALGVNTYTVHNAKHYQIAHLLEFGHIMAGTGKRARAIPHIAPANEAATRQFIEEVERIKL